MVLVVAIGAETIFLIVRGVSRYSLVGVDLLNMGFGCLVSEGRISHMVGLGVVMAVHRECAQLSTGPARLVSR